MCVMYESNGLSLNINSKEFYFKNLKFLCDFELPVLNEEEVVEVGNAKMRS